MDLPKPPEDPELKNIIDKLANFVARNGPEFEQMTKQKQRDNPKFSFLFSGEHFNYYQYRVTTEQAIIKQQQKSNAQQMPMQMAGNSSKVAPWCAPGSIGAQITPQTMSHMGRKSPLLPLPQSCGPVAVSNQPPVQTNFHEQLEQMKQSAKDQIQQSENNLSAQYQSLMQQQQLELEEALSQAKQNQLLSLAAECEVSLDELKRVVQPIIDSCTKDAISNGKNWILAHFKSLKHGELVAYYLLERIIDKEASFELRLHLIYLINDLLHHCMRKNIIDLRQILEGVAVAPAFCLTQIAANDEGKGKLTKLLNLWENNHYFSPATIEKMKDPNVGIADYQAFLLNAHASVVAGVTSATNNHFMSLQKQHQEFVAHLNRQVASLEQQLQSSMTGPNMGQPADFTPPSQQANIQSSHSGTNQDAIQAPMSNRPHPNYMPSNFGTPTPRMTFNQPPSGFPGTPSQMFDVNSGGGLPPIHLPDLSKPPPGFPGGAGMGPPLPSLPPPHMFPPDIDLVPTIPYFDLPAGLMAPLVKLEDCEYTPLDPRDIRLPPPMPPSERLLAAVEAFYCPPSHDRPRDNDGWEKLGLFEFFKAKNKAKTMKLEMEASSYANKFGSHEMGGSSTQHFGNDPLYTSQQTPFEENNMYPRIYRSPSPKGRGCRRSGSRSPADYRRSSRSRSRSRSKSRSRSRSRSFGRRGSREASRSPDYFPDPYYQPLTRDQKLGEDNKGHRLMLKMGWGGGALGTTGEGILDPIEHAEVRDRLDQFKGFGMSMNDPYELFRKNKSTGFNVRMKERAEARSAYASNMSPR